MFISKEVYSQDLLYLNLRDLRQSVVIDIYYIVDAHAITSLGHIVYIKAIAQQ